MKPGKMKKILSILLAVMLLVCLSACGKTIGTGGDKPAGGVVEVTDNTNAGNTDSNEISGGSIINSEEGNDQQALPGGNANDGAAYFDDGQLPYDEPVEDPTEAPTEAPTETPTEDTTPMWTISVTVDGGPYGGVFGGGTYNFYYQPTAFDALTATGISYTGDSNYVRSINGLAEFDHGPMSGWLYWVNNEEPQVGCGSYYLNDGDIVYWHYQGDE